MAIQHQKWGSDLSKSCCKIILPKCGENSIRAIGWVQNGRKSVRVGIETTRFTEQVSKWPQLMPCPIRVLNFTTILYSALEALRTLQHILQILIIAKGLWPDTNEKRSLMFQTWLFLRLTDLVIFAVWYKLDIYNGWAPKGLFVPFFHGYVNELTVLLQ